MSGQRAALIDSANILHLPLFLSAPFPFGHPHSLFTMFTHCLHMMDDYTLKPPSAKCLANIFDYSISGFYKKLLKPPSVQYLTNVLICAERCQKLSPVWTLKASFARAAARSQLEVCASRKQSPLYTSSVITISCQLTIVGRGIICWCTIYYY